MSDVEYKAEERRATIVFANRLRALRFANGHSTQTFADAIGISEETYKKFELAECHPSLDALVEIKRFTSCDLDFLMTGKRFNDQQPSRQNIPYQLASDDLPYPQPSLSWYWETDAEHRVVISCRPIEERSSPAGAIGMTMWEYNEVDLKRNEHWKHHKKLSLAHRPFVNFVYRGRKEFLKAMGKPMFDANGVFQGHRGYCTKASPEDVFNVLNSDNL